MNKIRLIILFAIVASITGCKIVPEKAMPITDTEYKIYATVLDSLIKDDGDKYIFLKDSTDRNHLSSLLKYYKNGQMIKRNEFEGLNEIDSTWRKFDHMELENDYGNKNSARYPIDNNEIHSIVKLQNISADSLYKIFRLSEDGWMMFRQLYPNSAGIIKMSRIGFNKRNDQAIMYLDFVQGELNGVGYYILLYKDNSKWRIRKIFEAWVS